MLPGKVERWYPMHDKELYQQILGLSKPWVVESVELDREKEEVVITVGLKGPNSRRFSLRGDAHFEGRKSPRIR